MSQSNLSTHPITEIIHKLKEQGMTIKDIEKAMDNRVSKRTLYRWAAGTKEPKQTSNIDSLYRLLKPEDS